MGSRIEKVKLDTILFLNRGFSGIVYTVPNNIKIKVKSSILRLLYVTSFRN